ncbi:hypothetical protein [Paracoccus sp. NSM]|uniref:hypothetical protein n=1 Tax=Paracoccus sp. NSM TaxID=3457784 RepID=UPI0040368F96
MKGLLRKRATEAGAAVLIERLQRLDRDLIAACAAPNNPLTVAAQDELARLHRRLRCLRHLIELEAGKR